MKKLFFLDGLARFSDATLFFARLLTGAFLIWGVWDNVVSKARMVEFQAFMTQFGFPAPHLLAPLSVYAQCIGGALLVLGLFTRWAGLFMAFNFVVGFFMVHLADDFRAQFPALILIAVNLHFAAAGGGRYSIDRFFK